MMRRPVFARAASSGAVGVAGRCYGMMLRRGTVFSCGNFRAGRVPLSGPGKQAP